jgi:hypothetical protein
MGLLARLAVPRVVGSPGHAAVRDLLAGELERRGLAVETHAFEASTAPLRRTRWAAALVAVAAIGFGIAAAGGMPLTGLVVAGAAAALGAPGVVWPATSGERVPAANLVGRPPGDVRIWLMAHFDAKGQRVSMATRLAGAVLLGLQGPALLALAALWAGGGWRPWLAVLALPGALGGAILACADLRNDSPGAVDNASGVLTVLAVLDRLPAGAAVGVAFTDAEELGLQGARALVRARPELFRDRAVVNVDGVDDHGRTLAAIHTPGILSERIVRTTGARVPRWLPALVDGLAVAGTARECLTLSRGDWATTRVVHTSRDAPDRLGLHGVATVATLVAAAVRAEATGER